MKPVNWLASTIGKRGYIADYLRSASPPGSRVTGTGNDSNTVGFMSCESAYKLRSIDDEMYIDDVLDVCEKDKITAVVTLSDIDVRTLAAEREKFIDKGINCFFPDISAALIFGDKWKTFESLQTLGFSVPITWESPDHAMRAGARFPLVVKPRMGSASMGVSVVHDEEQLNAVFADTEMGIVQEFLNGKLINVEMCCTSDGLPLVGTVWERLSSIDGETALARTIDHASALVLMREIIKQIPVAGPLDVDLVEIGDTLYVLEVNTRFGGGYPVSHLAGADFPGAMVESMNGSEKPDFDRYRRGVVMMKALVPMEYDHSLVKDLSNGSA